MYISSSPIYGFVELVTRIGGRIDVVQELERNRLGVRELAEREAKSVGHELM